MQKKLSMLLFFLICLFPFSAMAVIYVDIDNSGSENGGSWATAFNTIQEGINAASSGEEIWVAEGTYYIYLSSQDDTVSMANGVHLYGGFAGTEGLKTERNWENHPTIIDGHQYAGSAGQVQHVVTFYETSTISGYSATIDGFTITGGKSQLGPPGRKLARSTSPDEVFNTQGSGCGAGILIWRCSPTVENCTITANEAFKGGGVYNMVATESQATYSNPAPEFINCTFSYNSVTARGGGVSNDISTHPTFTRCTFMYNSCDAKGGAMYNDFGCSPTLVNCLIAKNTSEQGAAMGIDGSSSPKLVNCTVTDNYAKDIGAGLYTGSYLSNGGGGNNPILVNCIVWGNENQWCGPVDFSVWHENHFYISYSLVGTGFTVHEEDGDGIGVLKDSTVDPMFVNPDDGDYRLQTGSPCINTGTNNDTDVPTSDLDGTTRVSQADMGAYEYTDTGISCEYTLEDVITILKINTGFSDSASWKDAVSDSIADLKDVLYILRCLSGF